MEDTETSIWPAYTALTPSFSSMGRLTLNEDPSNVLAEQLAMDHCTKGFDVVQLLSETELVVSSCGSMIPGTPDGGFIDSNGLLRLVQVVRVPLLPGMDASEVADTLYDTVLAKIVKSQAWMRQTGVLPHDFTIFCWLPPVGSYAVCLEQSDELLWTESLISNVRSGGWPFSLRVEVPEDPGGMFPTFFGQTSRERKNFAEDLLYFLSPADFEASDDDEVMEWHLFDEDFHESNDEPMVTEARIGRDASVVLALINLAIQYILQHADEDKTGASVDLFWKSNNEIDKVADQVDNTSLPRVRINHLGHYEEREKPLIQGVPLIHGLPLIQGREWWDYEFLVERRLCAKPRDDCLRDMEHPLQGLMELGKKAVFDSGCDDFQRNDRGRIVPPIFGHPSEKIVRMQAAEIVKSCHAFESPAFDASLLRFGADLIHVGA